MAKKKNKSLEVAQRKYGYIFTLPFIIGGVLLVLLPLVVSIVLSFAEVKRGNAVGLAENFQQLFTTGKFQFLNFELSNWGLNNYKHIWLEDTNFRQVVLNSLQSMLYTVPVVVIFAFFIASVLNEKFAGRGFFRSVMFMPVIISSGLVVSLGSATGLLSQISSAGEDKFSADVGSGVAAIQVTEVFETMLVEMEIPDWIINLIVDSVSSISTIVSMAAISIVIFIAGLQSISPSIYEASYIEGATKWEVFWKISLPMVSPLILLSVVYTIVDNFNGSNNQVISTIHSNIISVNYDIASAMAVCYSIIILLILVVVFAVLNKVVFYQD